MDEQAEVHRIGPEGQLMDIGTVAAANIAKALGLADSKASMIKRAIADEINIMSAHFTSAIADVQFQYETQVAELRSTFRYVNENVFAVGAVAFAIFVAGFLLGKLL